MFWTFASLFIIISLAIYQYLRSRNDVFRRLGYPGPTPTILLGNLKEFFGTPISLKIREWTKQYGSTYGYYEGGKPVLVTSNVDVLHEVFIKQFGNFHSRKSFPLQDNRDQAKNVSLFASRGMRWKRLRNISNPTFTAAKLKSMMPILENSISEFLEILGKKCTEGESFDIYPLFQGLTLDTIARVAFGYETSVQQDQNSEILKLCRTIFSSQTLKGNPFTIAAMLFPELKYPLLKLGRFTAMTIRKVPGLVLMKKLRFLVAERRKLMEKNKGQKSDFIQLMLEAESNEGWENEVKFREDNPSLAREQIKELKIAKKLTSEEIVSQSLVFLLAGFETTSTALAFVTHLLAIHPEVQEKLQDEIDTVFLAKESNINYDTVTKLPYLDAVIKESLRLYPIASAVNARESSGPCRVNEIFIPGGMTVAADVWTIHYSTELWGDDAHIFKPERWSPENSIGRHPVAMLAFGIGPRNCIGMRFALLEEKLALARMLMRFSILSCDATEKKLELQGNQTVGPKHVTVKLIKRKYLKPLETDL